MQVYNTNILKVITHTCLQASASEKFSSFVTFYNLDSYMILLQPAPAVKHNVKCMSPTLEKNHHGHSFQIFYDMEYIYARKCCNNG